MKKKYSDSQIIEMLKEGNKYKKDNNIKNLKVMTKEEHIKLHTFEDNYGKRKRIYDENFINEVIKLHKNGVSNRKIALILGCGKSSVNKWINKREVA